MLTTVDVFMADCVSLIVFFFGIVNVFALYIKDAFYYSVYLLDSSKNTTTNTIYIIFALKSYIQT